jgi:hypothetical protein
MGRNILGKAEVYRRRWVLLLTEFSLRSIQLTDTDIANHSKLQVLGGTQCSHPCLWFLELDPGRMDTCLKECNRG